MAKINVLSEFFNSKSDANKHLEASEQEALEKDFQEWFDNKCKDASFAAQFLIRYLAEEKHPHAIAMVFPDAFSIYEGIESKQDESFILD